MPTVMLLHSLRVFGDHYMRRRGIVWLACEAAARQNGLLYVVATLIASFGGIRLVVVENDTHFWEARVFDTLEGSGSWSES